MVSFGQKLRRFCWFGGFCLLVQLHQEGSAPKACAAGLFLYYINKVSAKRMARQCSQIEKYYHKAVWNWVSMFVCELALRRLFLQTLKAQGISAAKIGFWLCAIINPLTTTRQNIKKTYLHSLQTVIYLHKHTFYRFLKIK